MVETRQAMGCGYEPAIKGAAPWTPRAQIEAGSTNTTCPGYTTSLPVVREVVDAYIHWERGTLADVIGARPTPTALHCLTALAAGSNEQRDQRLRDLREQRGGGG